MSRRAQVRITLTLALASFVALGVRAGASAAASEAASSASLSKDVKEIDLPNGLRVFVLERHVSPTFAGYYQFGVGGARDPKGRSGIAHLLEHMMFKGTRTLGTLDPVKEQALMKQVSDLWHQLQAEQAKASDPFHPPDQVKIDALKKQIEEVSAEHKKLIAKNEFDEVLSRAGGVAENASTANDVTNYFEMLPSSQLELWFQIESDRVLNPVFREFWSERDVVHEERRTSTENQAEGRAWEALEQLLYPGHPYGTPVVGWPEDIDALTQEDAERYFHTYYSPSNCTMVLVGDVTAADVERLARKYFSPWKRQEIPPFSVATLGRQDGERRATVEFDAEPQVFMGWRTVPAGNADQYALDLLGSILGGLESSRIAHTVIQEKRIATQAWSNNDSERWAGAFMVGGQPTEGKTVGDVEKAIDAEVAKIVDKGVTSEEMERARVAVETSRVQTMKDNLGLAFTLGQAVGTSGDVHYADEYMTRLMAVTATQVQDVAKRYLTGSRECVVEVKKTAGKGGDTSAGAGVAHQHGGEPGERGAKHSKGYDHDMAMLRAAKPVDLKVPEVGKDVHRVVLPCGATVFVKEDHTVPVVQLGFTWLGGSNSTPVEGLAPFELASGLLTDGGTEKLDIAQLQEERERLGMQFSIDMGDTSSSASFWSLSRNFDESFGLALDMLMKPRLSNDKLQVIKSQHVDEMKRRYDYPGWAVYILRGHVLFHDNPRLGYEASRKEIEAVTPADVRTLWEKYAGRDNMVVTAVGDFKEQELLDLIQRSFGPWRKAQDSHRVWITHDLISRPGIYEVEKEVAAPAVNFALELPIDRTASAADHAALDVLNEILGGSGFRSRLMERLRSDEGLTYGVYSYVSHEGRPGQPGILGVGWETKKFTVAKSIQSAVEEVRKIVTDTVSSEEVAEQVDAWKARFIFRFTDSFYSVSRLVNHELDDRPYDRDRQVLAAIQAVTPADVARVARQYLKPENMTIAVFGSLTDDDRAALSKTYQIHVLPKAEVFKGGYDAPDATTSGAPAAASESR